MSKRPRHEGNGQTSSEMTEADSKLGEEVFGSLCSVIEGFQPSDESSTGPRLTSAALRQARMMFEAYLVDAQGLLEVEEAKAKHAAAASNDANASDVASPTTNNVIAERDHTVVALCNKLNTVRKQLRNWVPYGSLVASETLITPTKSDAFDSTIPSFEIDNFLYPEDDDVEDLCEKGLVSRNYCMKCRSTLTAPTQFVSHSFSRDQLLYITCFLTPFLEALDRREDRGNAKGIEKVVDVGSRLGIVLTSFFYANPTVKSIVGIEVNNTLCELQRRLLKAHRATDSRVAVVNTNVLSEEGLSHLQSADVVILHNVFEWFTSEADQLAIWAKIRSALSRKGQWLIIAPKLEESLTCLAANFDKSFNVAKFVSEWVEEVDVSEPRDQFVSDRKGGLYGSEEAAHGGCDDDDCEDHDHDELPEYAEQCDNIHVYRVKG